MNRAKFENEQEKAMYVCLLYRLAVMLRKAYRKRQRAPMHALLQRQDLSWSQNPGPASPHHRHCRCWDREKVKGVISAKLKRTDRSRNGAREKDRARGSTREKDSDRARARAREPVTKTETVPETVPERNRARGSKKEGQRHRYTERI